MIYLIFQIVGSILLLTNGLNSLYFLSSLIEKNMMSMKIQGRKKQNTIPYGRKL